MLLGAGGNADFIGDGIGRGVAFRIGDAGRERGLGGTAGGNAACAQCEDQYSCKNNSEDFLFHFSLVLLLFIKIGIRE